MKKNPFGPEGQILFVLERLSSLADWICKSLAMLLMIAVAVAAIMQVIGRYFIGSSYLWLEEFMRYGFIWMTMLGAVVLVKTKGHAVIDVLVYRLSGWPRRIHEIFVYLSIMAGMAVLLFKGLDLIGIVSSQKSPALRIPMSYPYSVLPITSVFIILHCFLAIYRTVLGEDTFGTDKES